MVPGKISAAEVAKEEQPNQVQFKGLLPSFGMVPAMNHYS